MIWSCCTSLHHIAYLCFLMQSRLFMLLIEMSVGNCAWRTTPSFQKKFCYCWSQSVSMLQTFLGCPTWEQLVEQRKISFLGRVQKSTPESLARVLTTWILFLNVIYSNYMDCCIVILVILITELHSLCVNTNKSLSNNIIWFVIIIGMISWPATKIGAFFHSLQTDRCTESTYRHYIGQND